MLHPNKGHELGEGRDLGVGPVDLVMISPNDETKVKVENIRQYINLFELGYRTFVAPEPPSPQDVAQQRHTSNLLYALNASKRQTD